MKAIFKIAAAAVVALSFASEEAGAVSTSIGTFTLGALTTTNPIIKDSAVDQSFNFQQGSFTDVFGFSDFANTPASGNIGLNGVVTGNWYSGSLGLALKYAKAFKAAIIENAADFIAQGAILHNQNNANPAFAPEFTSPDTAAYLFAYQKAEGINELIINAAAVIYNGADDPTVVDNVQLRTSTSPASLGVETFTIDGQDFNGQLWQAVLVPDTNVPVDVPEIDGPVLAQVGFVLAGLYFVLVGYRRREDNDVNMDMGQAV